MCVEYFLDTNILVYAAAGRAKERAKRKKALTLIEDLEFGLSVQVLQEFYVTVTRKIEIPLSPHQALEWVEQFETFQCVPIETSLVKIAAEISERFKISYWDGAIVAAAELLGAHTLYSEDLNHEQKYGPVQVIDPFR